MAMHPCPHCKERLSPRASAPPGQTPAEGDWSVCPHCGGRLVIGAELAPRRPLPGEWGALILENPETANRVLNLARKVRDRIIREEERWCSRAG